jgi:hypothetical protein
VVADVPQKETRYRMVQARNPDEPQRVSSFLPVELFHSLIFGRRPPSSASLATTAGNSVETFLLLPGLPAAVPCVFEPFVPFPPYSTGS